MREGEGREGGGREGGGRQVWRRDLAWEECSYSRTWASLGLGAFQNRGHLGAVG